MNSWGQLQPSQTVGVYAEEDEEEEEWWVKKDDKTDDDEEEVIDDDEDDEMDKAEDLDEVLTERL